METPPYKSFFTGLKVPQEFNCLALEDLKEPLRLFVTSADGKLEEAGSRLLFLGYKPLTIAIVYEPHETWENDLVVIHLQQGPFVATIQWMDIPADTTSVARLLLRRVSAFNHADKTVVIYEGVHGSHRFLGVTHQWLNNLRSRFRRRSVDNISLPGNLADQVRIAYSVPRIISIITVSDGVLLNAFPTDLHGRVGTTGYISSLRKDGKANEQVEKLNNVVIAEVDASRYREVYAMGKNHMKMLRLPESTDVSAIRSSSFRYPLPAGVLRYQELKRIFSVDSGIHRLHFYHVVNEESVGAGKTLAHVHHYYSQWRMNQGIPLKILFR